MERSEYSDEVRAARRAIAAGAFDEAELRYAAIIDRAIGSGRHAYAVRALLELVVQLADCGELDRAQEPYDRAMLLAIETAMPIDHGDFTYAEAELSYARGDDLKAVQRFIAASEEFHAHQRDTEFVGAISRYAWTVNRVGTRRQALDAHRVAERALKNVLPDPAPYALLLAQHLREIGRAEHAVHGATREGGVAALGPYLEARDLYIELESVADVAELDVEIGGVYRELGMLAAARQHWETARDGLLAIGDADRAREVERAIAGLDAPSTEFGPSAP